VLAQLIPFPGTPRPADTDLDTVDRTPLAMDVLVDIANGIAATPLWHEHASHDPLERRPVRLLATPRYEVWVIGWTTDQNVTLHDHGDSAGVIAVTEGRLTELVKVGSRLQRVELRAGSVRRLPAGLVHDVVNHRRRPATSVHVYSPPLTAMAHYDEETLSPVRTEIVLPEPTALGPAGGSAAFHTSGRAR
jgi:mannose-6-phosphate isomerase-like protein (cupin superfamily)